MKYHVRYVERSEVQTTEDEATPGAWFDMNRRMRQELIDALRWAAAWKAKAKELWRENKKLAEFKEQQCSTCDKYWGCKWAYHLDGCTEWESRLDHRNE